MHPSLCLQALPLAPLPQVDFNDVFSLRKPRDCKAGLSSGLKSVAKGVFGGLAGLVGAPILGANTGGLVGFAKGLAAGTAGSSAAPSCADAEGRWCEGLLPHTPAGVAGVVVLPVTGMTVGVVQVVRGLVNTPEAVYEATQGKLWDDVSVRST